MRKLNEGHEVWYEDGFTKMSKTLKALSKQVKQFEDEGYFVQSAQVQEWTDEHAEVFYTGVIVVDRSFPYLP